MVPMSRLMDTVGDRHQSNTMRPGRRPYGVGCLVAGYDGKANLYQTCPSGNFYAYKAMAIGGRSQSARTYLENHYETFADSMCSAPFLFWSLFVCLFRRILLFALFGLFCTHIFSPYFSCFSAPRRPRCARSPRACHHHHGGHGAEVGEHHHRHRRRGQGVHHVPGYAKANTVWNAGKCSNTHTLSSPQTMTRRSGLTASGLRPRRLVAPRRWRWTRRAVVRTRRCTSHKTHRHP